VIDGRAGVSSRAAPGDGCRASAPCVRDGKIVELDFLSDPERLAQLDLTVLDG
jgi:hypothetical protein